MAIGLLIQPPTEVVLIDAAVPDPDFFLSHLQRRQQGIVLSPQSNLATVTQQLTQFPQLQAIHVITHGAPGQIQLGKTLISHQSLTAQNDFIDEPNQRSLLAQWGQVLAPAGDLILYGCDIAATATGQAFVTDLQAITQADIAASDNLSGSEALKGDWTLETATGAIAAVLPLAPHYRHILRQLTVTRSDDQGEGTLRWAIAQANQTPEDDLIELKGLTDAIVLRSPLPTIRSNLYLWGHGATVSGQGHFRVLSVADSNVRVRDLTLADGFAQGADGSGSAGGDAGLGGGLFVADAGVTLSRVRLVNNRAAGGAGGDRPQPIPADPTTLIEHEKRRLKVNRGALAGIDGLSLPQSQPPSTDHGEVKISGTAEKFSANRGAIAGVNGIGIGGIGSIAFGGGGGFGGFGNAGNGGNGGNGGAEGGNGGNGGDGGNGGVGIFGSFGEWEDQGSIGTIAYGGGGGFGGFGNAGNGGNGGNIDGAIAQGGDGGNGGNGGFGGGGGGGGYGGMGGASGHPGRAGTGGFGGGNGELGHGGGGAGLGGAIFLKSGRLILHRTEFDHNAAIAGIGAHPGQGKGGAIFSWPNSETTVAALQIVSLGEAPHFYNNTAPDAIDTEQDNADVFGTIKVFGSNQKVH